MNDKIREQMKVYDQLYKEQADFYCKAAQWAGLSDAAHWVLYRLYGEKRDMVQSELCKEWFYSKQTINSAVAKLVEAGYVELKQESGKGHRKWIMLTEAGKRFSRKYVAPILTAEQNSFEILTNEEREILIRLMKKQLEELNKGVEGLWQ